MPGCVLALAGGDCLTPALGHELCQGQAAVLVPVQGPGRFPGALLAGGGSRGRRPGFPKVMRLPR
jgi:hypothetical protein